MCNRSGRQSFLFAILCRAAGRCGKPVLRFCRIQSAGLRRWPCWILPAGTQPRTTVVGGGKAASPGLSAARWAAGTAAEGGVARPAAFLQERAEYLAGRLALLEATKAKQAAAVTEVRAVARLAKGSGQQPKPAASEEQPLVAFEAALEAEQLSQHLQGLRQAGAGTWAGLAAAGDVDAVGAAVGMKKLEVRRLRRLRGAAAARVAVPVEGGAI